MFEMDEDQHRGATIKVIGVGGGGCNAVDRMLSQIEGVDLIACNTDLQVLNKSLAMNKIQIGSKVSKGLGAGSNPEVGQKAAEEDSEKITAALEGADMVFVTAGMGGGTGTGASPVIAEIAKKMGALTVGVVTTPFLCEGKLKMRKAETGIAKLRQHVDSLMVIPNEKLIGAVARNSTITDAFHLMDEILVHGVQGITDIINKTGMINRDFADVRTTLSDAGVALMGTGYGIGEGRALNAVQQAIQHPLIADVRVDGARSIIVNVVGGPDVTMHEFVEAIAVLEKAAHPDVELLTGFRQDPNLQDEVRVTVIATRFGNKEKESENESGESKTLDLKVFLEQQGFRSGLKRPKEIQAIDEESLEKKKAFFGTDNLSIDIPAFLRRGR